MNSEPNEGQRRRLSRRGLLAGSAAGVVGATGVAGAVAGLTGTGPLRPVSDADRPRHRRFEPGTSGLRVRWLGNNGWELTIGTGDAQRTVLIDPWITRFRTGTYTSEGADPSTPLTVDTALIDRHDLKADHILVTHGHYDHMTDVPYLAGRTGATVLGTESHVNMMRALDAPAAQLSIVRGGEYLQCDGYTVQVLRSLHSMTGPRAQIPYPGTRFGAPPQRPRVISELVEGETLAYQVTAPSGFSVINFGGSNFSANDLAGLRPNMVMVPAGGGSIHEFVPRLLETLGHPQYVLPTHWDDFDYPLDEPAKDWGGLDTLRAAVKKASPDATFVVLDHLKTVTP